MGLPEWVPEGLDITVPSAARMYDYALGGDHNFEVDRVYADRAEEAWPGIRLLAHANRAYLERVVRHLAAAGVRQFLDIGSGIPTLGNVHEVAQDAAPQSRVVYVDIDPVAVSHSAAILAGNPRATVIQGDLRRPEEILDHPEVAELLDFSQPVAVLLIAVLHFVADSDDPRAIIARLVDELPSDSYVALSHGTLTPELAQQQERVRRLYNRTPTPVRLRDAAQLREMLGGLEVVEPGIVPVTDWHPEPEADEPDQPAVLGAVARKR
ncbi:SAM-dependent methyltransferase [Micromonospora sp. NPDC049559]|uniref:SAM-dependent methyltransferase n=1 Tax=Micromonospora sp. NPDC049559 TaxID=3155923 RepID=UPI00344A141D